MPQIPATVESQSRDRKHCYAVADSMQHFAQLRGEDVDLSGRQLVVARHGL
jgi:hypothetical protein